jgi:type IV secretion system protein TrbL
MDHNILTNILTAFVQNATMGYAYIAPDALKLLRYIITFNVVLFGTAMALGKSNLTSEAIKKLFLIAIYVWLVQNVHVCANIIIKNFAAAGVTAGGNAISLAEIFDPSAIVGMGFDATRPIFDSGVTVLKPHIMFMKGITGLLTLICFFYIAWQLFLSILEFYIISVVSVILIPFGLFKPLSFLSDKSIAAIFALAIRFMIVAFIISLSYKTLQTMRIPDDHTFTDALNMFLVAGTIAYLCKSAPQLAAVYFGGGGGLSGGLLGAAALGIRGGISAASDFADKAGRIKDNLSGGKNKPVTKGDLAVLQQAATAYMKGDKGAESK